MQIHYFGVNTVLFKIYDVMRSPLHRLQTFHNWNHIQNLSINCFDQLDHAKSAQYFKPSDKLTIRRLMRGRPHHDVLSENFSLDNNVVSLKKN